MTESERTHNDLQDTKQKAKYWATRRPAKPGVSIQMGVALELISIHIAFKYVSVILMCPVFCFSELMCHLIFDVVFDKHDKQVCVEHGCYLHSADTPKLWQPYRWDYNNNYYLLLIILTIRVTIKENTNTFCVWNALHQIDFFRLTIVQQCFN
jgi:hypothetical protein